MRWSKLKQIIESRICDEFSKRIAIYSTASCFCRKNRCPFHCGKIWLTLDKREVASFAAGVPISKFEDNGEFEWSFVQHGTYERRDIHEHLWKYIHEDSLEDALASSCPLVQSLAIMDNRLGKRRLNNLSLDTLHPLAQKFLTLRVGGRA